MLLATGVEKTVFLSHISHGIEQNTWLARRGRFRDVRRVP